MTKTHGGRSIHAREYRSWRAMMRRCYEENFHKYPAYGGRGIKVCDRWHFFENFLADMGKRPEAKTLDRKDGTREYSPSNCRWATSQEQRHNRVV